MLTLTRLPRPAMVRDRPDSGVSHESGQAITEFAIVMFPLLMLVAGIIQFGIGLNFWIDQQRIANQGARWAVVNCNMPEPVCDPTLEEYLETQTLSNGNNPTATVCFESKSGPGGSTAIVGDAITVRLQSSFTFVPIVGVGTITLRAKGTQRLEQNPTHDGIKDAPLCSA